MILIFTVLIIIAIIILIKLAMQQPYYEKKDAYLDNKFTQILDSIIKEAKDNYNSVYDKIASSNAPINCNNILYWIKDDTLYSIIQFDAYIKDIEKKLTQQKCNVVYNSRIPEINFTYDAIPVEDIKYFTKEATYSIIQLYLVVMMVPLFQVLLLVVC